MNGSSIPRFVAVVVVMAAMMAVLVAAMVVASTQPVYADEVSADGPRLVGECARAIAQNPPPEVERSQIGGAVPNTGLRVAP
jgi:hypothetical protein